jgi:hypothetical protein
LPQRVVQARLSVVRFAGELRRRVREEAQVAHRARDFHAACQLDGLAAIAGFGARHVFQPGFHRIGQAFHPARAFAVGQRGPGGQGALGGCECGVDITRVAGGDLRIGVCGGRVEHVEPAATGRFAGFAVDPVREMHSWKLTATSCGRRRPAR